MDSTSRIRGRRRIVVGLLATSALAAGGGLALAGPALAEGTSSLLASYPDDGALLDGAAPDGAALDGAVVLPEV